MRLLAVALISLVPGAATSAPEPTPLYSDPPSAEAALPGRPASEMPVVNPNGAASSICPPTSRYEAARRGGKLGPSLLNQLPAADMYNAVYRRIGGCEAPIIVRYDVGGATRNGR